MDIAIILPANEIPLWSTVGSCYGGGPRYRLRDKLTIEGAGDVKHDVVPAVYGTTLFLVPENDAYRPIQAIGGDTSLCWYCTGDVLMKWLEARGYRPL